ncbi:hypothetical protein CHS0354_040708 [Potamilus streckersoni]|uniref:Uncharacterized protein n=1 Tax=Potamilus streckersoni TaxID=2493646 RepID=A0AAE0VYT1_9BIVA|nr:hypothetical protein CHS0354_040708 [Potamilus streckersoni]
MLLLTCGCLNIKIYCKGDSYQALILENSPPIENFPAGFFPNAAAEVDLDAQGVTVEHSFLVHKRKIGDYTLYRCLNCRLDSYASSSKGSKVVISSSLEYNPHVIERLAMSVDYSAIFRIILRGGQEMLFTGKMPDASTRKADSRTPSYESLQSSLNSIQQMVTAFLMSEEAKLEDKLRSFEESERGSFSDLQAKVREEKKKMISLLLSTTPMTNAESSDNEATVVTHRKDADKKTPEKVTPKKKMTVSRVKSLPQESEALFTLDDFEDFGGTCQTGVFSEEDEEDGEHDENEDIFTGSIGIDHPNGSRKLLQKYPVYSSSVPISVPTWKTRQQALEEEEALPSDPEQIAASMQALAQSITDEGRYIFGDRPRPRINTGDFPR